MPKVLVKEILCLSLQPCNVNKKIIIMKNETVYINLLTDFGFKRIFGREENKDILIAFLNACLAEFSGTITDITYLQTEQIGDRPVEKRVVFDLYCTNQHGERFIIELQRNPQHFYADRSISYVSRVVSQEMRRGEREYRIPKIYSINILDFEADEFKGEKDYFWPVQLKDKNNKIFSKKITLIFIELNKFAARNQTSEFSGELQKWLYLLKNISKMKVPDKRLQDGIFRKLFDNCEYSKLNTMEKEAYRKSVLDYEDVQDAVRYAQEEALKEGFEKGKEEGREEGREEGLAQGRYEEKKQIALTMMAEGFDLHVISNITNLSEEEIMSF